MPETARYLDISDDTVRRWVHAVTRGGPLVHAVPTKMGGFGRYLSMPLIAVAEVHALRSFREVGVPLKEFKRTADVVRRNFGTYGFATRKFATDGKTLFVDIAAKYEPPSWARGSDFQIMAPRIWDEHLQLLEFDDDNDDYPQRIRSRRLVRFEVDAILDPNFGFGEPVFRTNKVRVRDVADAFRAGETIQDIAYDYELDEIDVSNTIRALVDQDLAVRSPV